MMIGDFSFITNPYKADNGKTTHDLKKSHHPTGTVDFICIDGEGMNINGQHRYVLLGIGDRQIEDRAGLHYRDVFQFISDSVGDSKEKRGLVGFYLGYDFTQWFRTLPEPKARRLLTIEGRESRRSKSPKLQGKFLPVDLDGWQVDTLGARRIQIRTKECDCDTVKCPHPKGPWIYICDAGPFFQTSFLNVINPANWQESVVTDDEYRIIEEGKAKRDHAELDDDMRMYNRLENEVFARVLRTVDKGLRGLDVHLAPSQWFGPGQAAQAWMKGRAPKLEDVAKVVPDWFLDAARQSYFGGWFEIMAHGHVPGESYEYDINTAYPYIISTLPCLLHGIYSHGTGKPPKRKGALCLVRATVWGCPPDADKQRGRAIGAMLHRDSQGRICRPLVTSGWFWLHELDAARRAGFITRVSLDRWHEWVMYEPCDCQPPMWQVKNLFQLRIDVGNKSSLGKSAKVTNNSIYGKFAQSVGKPLFANPVYASLITSGCRTMITDAIATHPGGKNDVLMVATDAVFFRRPHPLLTIGKGLGEWETIVRSGLTLFKPGVYWDDAARRRISLGHDPQFKARGISAKAFAASIAEVDEEFALWEGTPPSSSASGFTAEQYAAMAERRWPRVTFTAGFAMTTALQALVRNDWESAGTVTEGKELVQNANPDDKRGNVWYDDSTGLYRSEPHVAGANARYRHLGNISEWDNLDEHFASVPYEKKFGLEDPFSDEVQQAFGISPDEHQPYRGAFRILTGAE